MTDSGKGAGLTKIKQIRAWKAGILRSEGDLQRNQIVAQGQ